MIFLPCRVSALTVDLVKEYDAGLAGPRLLEEQTELPLSLADPLAEAVGTLAHEEGLNRQASIG